MSEVNRDSLDQLETTLNYIAATGDRPAYYLYEPTDRQVRARPEPDRQAVSVFDMRAIMETLTLDDNGFGVVHHAAFEGDYFDEESVRSGYYAQAETMVKTATGAARAMAFDHNVRSKDMSQREGSGVREPVRFVHNDYTEKSGPQRVRDLMGDAAEDLLTRRYAFINVWRPIAGPVLDVPLAVCDAGSMAPSDFIATDLEYEDRTGEVYSVRHSPAHRWFYISRMQPDEVLLLKCFDSATDGRARYTAHSAFRNPHAPVDAPARQSIEVRTIAFFDL